MREIKTKRLLLRKLRSDDAESIFRNRASDSEVAKYVTWNVHKDMNETKAILDMWLAEDGFDTFVIEAADDNVASNKVILKNGFKLVGKREDRLSEMKPQVVTINSYRYYVEK